jgi:hypothetical protein
MFHSTKPGSAEPNSCFILLPLQAFIHRKYFHSYVSPQTQETDVYSLQRSHAVSTPFQFRPHVIAVPSTAPQSTKLCTLTPGFSKSVCFTFPCAPSQFLLFTVSRWISVEGSLIEPRDRLSHGRCYEQFHLLGYGAVGSAKSQPMFRSNI